MYEIRFQREHGEEDVFFVETFEDWQILWYEIQEGVMGFDLSEKPEKESERDSSSTLDTSIIDSWFGRRYR